MKDNYVADIGDYGKYALLRHLTASREDGTAPPALGVVWYLTEHTEENNDGRHTRYLEKADAYRALDPALFDHLTDIIARARDHAAGRDGTPTPRCVAEVERVGILPTGTRFAAAPVAGRGWDDDWTAAERDEMGHMHWLFLQAECDWARLRAAVDVLTGFRQENPGFTPEG